ncbi:VOC family protein [Melghirimyces algeriensis]|uniref:Metallothiol transferase n=1 Tax=Melghirimyces algeriensis TaxID=910412 RepID=A0A521EK21_9BACL|nr:VOC family protein [Melghirimyces algeriensis]SMO84268.1 metallothiol transferase [Melghirimyces algeriensis]
MNVSGFNHITIRVSRLETSLAFYRDILKMNLVHQGRTDVYLEWGTAWICLIETDERKKGSKRGPGVDHIAFSIQEKDFDQAVEQLLRYEIPILRGPVERGGGRVVNFLDPDQIQLELNTGNLYTRMKHWR